MTDYVKQINAFLSALLVVIETHKIKITMFVLAILGTLKVAGHPAPEWVIYFLTATGLVSSSRSIAETDKDVAQLEAVTVKKL